MEGFTPWEYAALKVVYHRYDRERKGYLSRSDLQVLCRESSLPSDEAAVSSIFARMDLDGDEHVDFREFVSFISLTGENSVEQVAMRGMLLTDKAAVCAGAAMGLLPMLKGKLVVLMGTMFYDPIRLFRDTYVDYTTSIRAALHQKHAVSEHVAENLSFFDVLKHHARKSKRMGSTTAWFMFSLVLDTTAGAAVFLSYSRVRMVLANATFGANNPPAVSSGVTDARESLAILSSKEAAAAARRRRGYMLEFASGYAAGIVGGLLERPCKYLARQHTVNLLRLVSDRHRAFQGTFFAVTKQSVSHAVFFSAFAWANRNAHYHAFQKPNHWVAHHTSFCEALATSAAGCAAGAAFRLVTVPMQNIYTRCFKPRTKVENFGVLCRRANVGELRRVAFSGLASSLIFTMPITGFAFLAYEMALVNL